MARLSLMEPVCMLTIVEMDRRHNTGSEYLEPYTVDELEDDHEFRLYKLWRCTSP
jgi:hypothetical protein